MMNLSLKHQIVVYFNGLLILSLSVILILTYRWTSKQVEESVNSQLNRCIDNLKQVHRAAADKRSQEIQRLVDTPFFHLLAAKQDKEEMRYVAAQSLKEVGCATFAFISSSGNVLAWEGIGREELGGMISVLDIKNSADMPDLLVIDDAVFEVAVMAMHTGDAVNGYILYMWAIDSPILASYNASVRATSLQLVAETTTLVSSQETPHSDHNLSYSEWPLEGSLRFIVRIDYESIIAPLTTLFRTLLYISCLCILACGAASFWIAHRIASPINELVRAVGEADMSVQALPIG